MCITGTPASGIRRKLDTEDGDIIEIDLNQNTIHLHVSDEILKARQKEPLKRPDHPAEGMLGAYRKTVAGAEKGAVWL